MGVLTKYFRFPFAGSGDQSQVADETQTSGILSYQEGFGEQYSRDPRTDPLARRIGRTRWNRVLNDITENLKFWQENTYPEWVDPTADNGGVPVTYGLGMIVSYNGNLMISLIAGNQDEPNNPTTWAPAYPIPQALSHHPGDVLTRIVDEIPAGFVELAGQAIDPSWTVLAAQFGANLPDSRDRALYGKRSGRDVGNYEEGQIKQHDHNATETGIVLSGTFSTKAGEGAHGHQITNLGGNGEDEFQSKPSASDNLNTGLNYSISSSGSEHIHSTDVAFPAHDHGVIVEPTGQASNTVDNIAVRYLVRVG